LPPVLLFAIVYHIECASTIIILKNQVLKKAETEAYKKSLALGRLGFSRFDFVWLFANFDRRKRNDIE
jgi:hypothetical protein